MNSSTEIKNLLKNIQNRFGYTLLEVAQKIGVTEAALSRWNNGKSEPTRKNLMALKQLADGHPQPQIQNGSSPPDIMGKIWGHIDQLTKQIAQLQGQVAVLEHNHLKRLDDGEKKRQLYLDII